MTSYFIINGTLYDPAEHRMYQGNLSIQNGKLISGPPSGAYETIDASGCIVTTGLIDFRTDRLVTQCGGN